MPVGQLSFRSETGFVSPNFSVNSSGDVNANGNLSIGGNINSTGDLSITGSVTADSITLNGINIIESDSSVYSLNNQITESGLTKVGILESLQVAGSVSAGSFAINSLALTDITASIGTFGNMLFSSNIIDTTDSSLLTLAVGVNFQSYIVVSDDITVNGSLNITDKISHVDDTNTSIRFKSNDTVTIETNNIERFIVDSSGNVGINNSNPSSNGWTSFNDLVVGNTSTNFAGITIQSSTSGECGIAFNDTVGQIQAYLNYNHTNESLGIGTQLDNARIVALGTLKVQQILEKITVSAVVTTGTVNFDVITQGVLYYTTNASGNFTLNVRGNNTNTLNSIMSNGESLTIAFLVTNGSPAYYHTGMQIDGNSVTPKWQGGSAPSSGNINSVDIYTYTVVKSSNSFTVFASQTRYT